MKNPGKEMEKEKTKTENKKDHGKGSIRVWGGVFMEKASFPQSKSHRRPWAERGRLQKLVKKVMEGKIIVKKKKK